MTELEYYLEVTGKLFLGEQSYSYLDSKINPITEKGEEI